MTLLKLHYQNGVFIPLDTLPALVEGQEITVQIISESAPPLPFEILPLTPEEERERDRLLNASAGLWADVEGLDTLLETMREEWANTWTSPQNS